MLRLYIAVLVAALFCGSYLAGRTIGRARCDAENITQSQNNQIKIIEQMDKINAEVYNTGVADIRRRLREKYTIAN